MPGWLRHNPHPQLDLLMQAVPPISGAALCAGLCIAFVSLSPHPRFSLVTAITFPSMHIAVTYALAQLLSSRSSALMQPMPQQLPIQKWLSTGTWLTALVAEFVVFTLLAIAARRKNVKEC
ncbi:MAG: hypothetical protein ACYC96_13740 [Fimbriimonadaceae bacterium]